MNRIFPTSQVSSVLSRRGRAWSTTKGCMGAHSGSLFLPSVEKKMHFWGVTHLSYFTHLLWDETKSAPKLHIPFCGPYWELGWVVTCQRNPFVLRTGYSKEKKGLFGFFLRIAALMSFPRETSICLRWEELSSWNHQFPWLVKTFIRSHLISPWLWWTSGRALPPTFMEGELS